MKKQVEVAEITPLMPEDWEVGMKLETKFGGYYFPVRHEYKSKYVNKGTVERNSDIFVEPLNVDIGTEFTHRYATRGVVYTLDRREGNKVYVTWGDEGSETPYPVSKVNEIFEEGTWVEIEPITTVDGETITNPEEKVTVLQSTEVLIDTKKVSELDEDDTVFSSEEALESWFRNELGI